MIRWFFLIQVLIIQSIFSEQIHKTKSLTPEQINKIAMRIWHNESGKSKAKLVFWSKHESFPSLGIGHFIWLPENHDTYFSQTFPALCGFLEKNNIILPVWLKKAIKKGCIWKTREEFEQDNKRRQELLDILSNTIDLQAQFMIERVDVEWNKIIKLIPEKKKKQIQNIYDLMHSTEAGTYALIDYINFKGSGTDKKEEANGHRWGLMQVLLDMPEKNITRENVVLAFSISAAKILVELVKKSAPEYSRIKFLPAWIRRVSEYNSTY